MNRKAGLNEKGNWKFYYQYICLPMVWDSDWCRRSLGVLGTYGNNFLNLRFGGMKDE